MDNSVKETLTKTMREALILATWTEGLSEAAEGDATEKVSDLAQLLLAIKASKEAISSAEKELNKARRTLERRFVSRMEAEELEQCVTAGHKFTLKPKGYFSLPPKNQPAEREAVVRALRENPETAPFVYEDVVTRSLNAYCSEQLEKGGEIPDGVRSYIETSVSIRQVD